ncbi:hypothetical protein [uncultured Pedobacter sp.]|nr:hypothetical protein [uncultured Pedobacter sp.]
MIAHTFILEGEVCIPQEGLVLLHLLPIEEMASRTIRLGIRGSFNRAIG